MQAQTQTCIFILTPASRKMKITSFYYLEYPPNDATADPTFVATGMYVERGDEGDSINSFQDTFSFQVYTLKYVQEYLIKTGEPLVGKSILIVPILDNDQMRKFLNDNVDSLAQWGEEIT